MRRKKKKQEVTNPIPENVNPKYIKFKKIKHVVCNNLAICNRFGYMPNKRCIETECRYASLKEIEIDITPLDHCRRVNMYNFVD